MPRPAPPLADPVAWLRRARRTVQWHRRLLAAGLLGAAVVLAVAASRPPPGPSVVVLTAARDLAPGARLDAGDLRVTRLPPGSVPAGALVPARSPTGRTVAGPVRRGEVLTDVRFVGRALVTATGAGRVAVPVRIADAASARLVQAGDMVDVVAAAAEPDGTSSAAEIVAAQVRVLAVPAPTGGALSGDLEGGALVVLATSTGTATRLAAAAVTSRLSLTLGGG